jgi:hypothetical protein
MKRQLLTRHIFKRYLARFSMLPLALLFSGTTHAQSTLTGPDADIAANGDYGEYYTWPELRAKIDGWKAAHPTLIHESTLGRTVENRRIPLLKISDNAANDEDEPEILLLVGVHPREQAPTIAIVRLIDDLLNGQGKDARLTRLVKEREIWIVPMLNVDGKIYDMRHGDGRTKGADWRKNRRVNRDKSIGVDLNRNFPMAWGAKRSIFNESWNASTAMPHGNIYEGPTPASEPETLALMDFITKRPLRVMVDVHSPLHDIRVPGYLIPSEHERYSKLLKGMQAAQKEPYAVRIGNPNRESPLTEYPGDTGVTFPWSYYTTGAYSFNLELAPRQRYAAPAEIETQYRDNVRGPLLYLIEASSDLPLAKPGTASLVSGVLSTKLTPGAKVLWTPTIAGPCDYAVLISTQPDIIVNSGYRLVPVQRGFGIEVAPNAKVGATNLLTLYLWNKNREVVRVPLRLTVEAP